MDLIKDPVPVLIRRIAIPASVGFFFNTMYNVVDTWFAGLISTQALAALSLSFPVFFLLLGLGVGISQGATALIGNALGKGMIAVAQHYSLQAISFGAILSILLTGIGFWLCPVLFHVLGASGPYLQITLAYMDTILGGSLFFLMQAILNASLNAKGDTRSLRDVLIAGFCLNCVLDPWFLYGGLGLPALGIRGIALATVVIQALGGLFLANRVRRTALWEGASWKSMVPNGAAFRELAYQGFPAAGNMMTVALGIFIITWFVSRFSTQGVAAYGIATRVEQIVLLPTIGLNVAVLSLTGQNNGAGLYHRIRETWLTAMKYGFGLMITGGTVLLLVAHRLMSAFTGDPEVVRIGTEYLHIAAGILCSYVILFQTVYLLQGLKRPLYGLWVGLYRQLAAPACVFYLLAFRLNWRLSGIWWGIFLVNWSAAVGVWFLGRAILRSVLAGEPRQTDGPDAAGQSH